MMILTKKIFNENILRFRSGITLPELLVAMILVGLLMISVFYVFSNFFKASISQERYTL